MLAAGSASRFGSDKLRHPLPHGVPIAVQSARHLKTQLTRVIAVVRPGADETARALAAEGCEVVVCRDAERGMGAPGKIPLRRLLKTYNTYPIT